MTASPTITARELAKAQREACMKGAMTAIAECGGTWPKEHAERIARDLYPLPTITLPREVTVPAHRYNGVEWGEATFRVVDGVLQAKGGDDWYDNNWEATPERIRVWADLFANPTETVEDEG